jgi:hypothetical protein
MSKTPQSGDWVKALRPGTIPASTGDKFIKAGEKFQLTDDIPFSDRWMEATDAPISAKPPSQADVKKEQEEAAREHEKTDAIRRGKFTHVSVPRSEEGRKEQEEQKREDLRQRREDEAARKENQAQRDRAAARGETDPSREAREREDREASTPRQPLASDPAVTPRPNRSVQPRIDRGSDSNDDPQGRHETSANPSRADENALRRDKE